jgi:hypothetical protein
LFQLRILVAFAVAGALACDRSAIGEGRSDGYKGLTFTYDSMSLAVHGLTRADMKGLRNQNLSQDDWRRLLRVSVEGKDSTPIAGRYRTRDSIVVFEPMYPFDAGRSYTFRFDASAPPLQRTGGTSATFTLSPAVNATPLSRIARILPSAAEWPENQLRFYVEFSAPMARVSGLHRAKLLDDRGVEVTHAFLPIEADFWNHDATRYTFFFDPGRVKRGILPNEEMGAPLVKGRRYTLVIDSLWKDASGRYIAAAYSHSFRATDAIHDRISIDTWSVRAPAKGTRNPLVVRFPGRLDHGLLLRALGVELTSGAAIPGEGVVGDGEVEWQFTPQSEWAAREYQIVVLSILEDAAGNRIDRPFEVDRFSQVDSVAAPERYTIKFVVR